jgi:hypothetical protein
MFYTSFKVKPTTQNPDYYRLRGAIAHLWIKEVTPEKAIIKAIDYIRRFHWEFQSWDKEISETIFEQFEGKEQAQERFLVATIHGIAAVFVGYESEDKIEFSIN